MTIEKRIKGASGYAPGKHPNSHLKRQNAVQERRARIQDQLSGLHERLGKVPGETSKAARAHLETANDRMSGLNHKEALQYYKRARNLINRLPAGHRKAVIGKISKKAKSGYGPGKNPNSHRKARAGGGFSSRDRRVINNAQDRASEYAKTNSFNNAKRSLQEAKDNMKAARDAKADGNLGATSYFARKARHAVRAARSGSTSALTPSDGLKYTRGADLYEDALRSRSGSKSGAKKHQKARVTKRDETELFVPIVKADAKEQVVYGWASPIKELGTEIIDRQGDVIDMGEVRQAAHEFMLHKRVGGSMHKQFDVGQVVESIVFDADIQKALGIDLPYEGWFIGVKVSKKEDWDKVVSGEYTGFSIGGSGIREPIEAEIIGKARGKSGYGPGKNPNSHKRDKAMAIAREAKAEGNKGKASFYASEARFYNREERGSEPYLRPNSIGLNAYERARFQRRKAKYEMGQGKTKVAARSLRNAERYDRLSRMHKRDDTDIFVPIVKARGKSGYGIGKNPNSHRRAKHLKAAKEWMAEARDVKSYAPDQAAYAVMQARKAVRRARGASTKTGSGKSMVARAARRFSRSTVDERD